MNQAKNDAVEPVQDEWDDSVPRDTWRNYAATGRLAGVYAAVAFMAIFFPSMGTKWGLPVATVVSYSVLAFALAFRDKNCSLSKPLVQDQVPKFLLIHLPFLLVVFAIEMVWSNEMSRMPSWLVARGRKGSLYDWMLLVLLYLIASRQARWMRAIIRARIEGAHGNAQ
jgi:hypothetical protein